MVKSWAEKGGRISWSIKVNRLITHTYFFNQKSLAIWARFKKLFEPMDDLIDFYLFQMHPKSTPKIKKNLERFIKVAGLAERFALEARHDEWFGDENMRWAAELGITFVSVDAPHLPTEVYNTSGRVYVRMHGRTNWYAHNYSCRELEEKALKIKAARPKAAYIFFNNDLDMLANARQMLRILQKKA